MFSNVHYKSRTSCSSNIKSESPFISAAQAKCTFLLTILLCQKNNIGTASFITPTVRPACVTRVSGTPVNTYRCRYSSSYNHPYTHSNNKRSGQYTNIANIGPIYSTNVDIPETKATSRSTIKTPSQNTNQRQSNGVDPTPTPPPLTEKALGALVLLTVPISWGTFAPVVRYVYDLEVPVPGFLFSALYYAVAATTLLSLNVFENYRKNNNPNVVDDDDDDKNPLPIRGGIELGTYLFIGNCLQVVGLESVPADRAAFLVQLTTVFVPLFQGFVMGGVISGATWLACLLAFVGVITMGFDDPTTTTGGIAAAGNANDIISQLRNGASFGTGDALIVLAAVAYTLHVVRLDKYAKSSTPLQLAAVKSTTEAIMATSLVGVLLALPSSTYGRPLVDFFENSPSLPPEACGAILWTGIVTCAYTIYAQSFGQKRLQNAVYANLIYSSQPLFSGLFAYGLLGEQMGFVGFVGGGLIALALGIVSLETNEEQQGGGETTSS